MGEKSTSSYNSPVIEKVFLFVKDIELESSFGSIILNPELVPNSVAIAKSPSVDILLDEYDSVEYSLKVKLEVSTFIPLTPFSEKEANNKISSLETLFKSPLYISIVAFEFSEIE